jgi:hypothetical protein
LAPRIGTRPERAMRSAAKLLRDADVPRPGSPETARQLRALNWLDLELFERATVGAADLDLAALSD